MASAAVLSWWWWRSRAGGSFNPPAPPAYDLFWPGLGAMTGIDWPNVVAPIDWPGI